MFKEILKDTPLNGVYAIIVMFLFIIAFILIVIYTFKIKKQDIDYYKNIPLENQQTKDTFGGQNVRK
ncbi:MAG: cbb3-type cytochrome c oxidase subunit 3 [Candidatus Kapabacteria bacterium]|nr:cbb3-type cytochrome c oxidase subunit 3 [Candidatus Kapabacteria bacterium]